MISLKKFINQANQNTDNEEIDKFLNLMRDAYTYQQYLTNKNFKVFKDFLEYIQALSKNDINVLNSTQQKIINKFRTFKEPITYAGANDEGGATLKYQPNGFISSLIIVGFCLAFGLLIAYLFIRII